MTRTKIDLAEPFEKIRDTLLTLPETHAAIFLQDPGESGVGEVFHRDSGVEEALRGIYEAANGRQVATQIGLLAIAPPTAAFLKKTPFYVATQADFLLEALVRLCTGSGARAAIGARKSERKTNQPAIEFELNRSWDLRQPSTSQMEVMA